MGNEADASASAAIFDAKVVLSSEVMFLPAHGGKFPVDFADT